MEKIDTRKTDDRVQVAVRMPEPLREAIRLDAFRNKSNMNDTIVKILSDNYGLAYQGRSNRRAPFGGGPRPEPVAIIDNDGDSLD